MLYYLKYVLIIMLSWLVTSCSTRQKTATYNISYAYHPEKTSVRSGILNKKDSLKIFLSYHNNTEYENISIENFISSNTFIYKIIYDPYSTNALLSDSILLKPSEVILHENTFSFSFSIPKIRQHSGLLLIYKKDLKRKKVEVTDIPLDSNVNSAGTNYLISHKGTGVAVLAPYLTTDDTVIIQSEIRPESSLFAYHYNHAFSPAAPPMSLGPSEKKTLDIDTSFQVKTNEDLVFKLPGLYFIQDDTTSLNGLSFFVKKYKFPSISRAEEMIEPLIYITSLEEQKKLTSSSNPKAAVDSFWLRIGGSKEYSRQLIKSYYQKVEYANKAFSSYKEGWKTDRGIIYVIFGKPDQVYKWSTKEEWVYENILTHIVTFTFVKKENLFSENHYELIRDPAYEKFWYLTVEKWRNGIITK